MNKVKIKVSVDVEDPKQVHALLLLFTAMGCPEEVPAKAEASKKKAVKSEFIPGSKAEAVETPTETPVKNEEPPRHPEAKELKATSEITVDMVRKALAEKTPQGGANSDANRQAAKSKLTELGAPNVSTLDPSKYGEMYNFLNSLK